MRFKDNILGQKRIIFWNAVCVEDTYVVYIQCNYDAYSTLSVVYIIDTGFEAAKKDLQ